MTDARHPQAHVRTFLLAEFRTRCEDEHDYNLSAYAKDLDLSPSQLSEILAGKHRLTVPKAKRIAECLKLSDEEYRALLSYVKDPGGETRSDSSDDERTRPLSGMELRAFQVAAKWVPALKDPRFLRGVLARSEDV